MSQWTAISRSSHADKRYWPRQGYSFAADQQIIPILLAELPKLIPHYPLAFIRQASVSQAVALTGLGSGQNLYLNPDGRWLAPYVPAFLRSHPFRLLLSEKKQPVLCIQEEHLTDDPHGEPLFDEAGNLAESVQGVLNFLNQSDKNRQVTQAACEQLDHASVIEKWPLQLKQGQDQAPLSVSGLYRINEKQLNGLEVEAYAGLRSNGAMALAYAQLFSMNQLAQLSERAAYHARQQPAQPSAEDIEKLFGDDDLIRFDDF